MFAKVIVSQSEGTYFDVEAVFVGEDEAKVSIQANKRLREIIEKKEEGKDDPMTDDEIEDAIGEGSYFDDVDDTNYEVHVFEPNDLVVVQADDFDTV